MFEDDFEMDEIHIELKPVVRKLRLPYGRRPSSAQSNTIPVGKHAQPEIYLSWPALSSIIDHAESSMAKEIGGFLLGTGSSEKQASYLNIKQSVKAQNTLDSSTSVTFTHSTWERFAQIHSQQYPNYGVAGWYHSHPGFGVFLSEYDMFIHRNFFDELFHVALVVDPVNREIGMFGWVDKEIKMSTSMTIYSGIKDRPAVESLLTGWEIITV